MCFRMFSSIDMMRAFIFMNFLTLVFSQTCPTTTCPPGMMICPGVLDATGCTTPDTCIPTTGNIKKKSEKNFDIFCRM